MEVDEGEPADIRCTVDVTPFTIPTVFILLFRFLDSVTVVEVDEGEPADIRCTVDATPLTNSTIKWQRKDYDFGE